MKYLKIVSVNCKSLRRTQEFIRDLCNCNDIILLQETWLLPTELNLVEEISENHDSIATSAIDSSKRVLNGRPHGGVAILFNKKLTVKIIECGSPRLAAVEVKISPKNSLLVITVYMPHGNRKKFSEFCDFLQCIHLITKNYNGSDCLIMGDFNAHPHSKFGKHLESFCREHSYRFADKILLPATSYTYVSDQHKNKSWLDHCITTERVHRSLRRIAIDYTVKWTDHRCMRIEVDRNILTSSENLPGLPGERRKSLRIVYARLRSLKKCELPIRRKVSKRLLKRGPAKRMCFCCEQYR
ncbi:hypothetical protein EVAR_91389_1 [Eumeta japonica]|uniref:Endonuclease/exonuclease/phosphatase domain-containing protein n=1 Tax=Eumeta variegata TaxID=151549 RepID=A0A4C1XD28_EUMVA|nr:hypothetical protein EVAR_91389_1 [Eumeta japonica]